MLTPQETRELFATMRSLARSGRADHLHHPQAARGARGLRPHLGDAPRADHRHDGQQGGHRRGDRQPHGRPRRPPARRQGRGRPDPGAAADGRAARRWPATAARRRSTICRFSVRAGEIVGLAGVQGNGQDELVEAITGLRRPLSGAVEVCGTPLRPRRSARRTRRRSRLYPGRPRQGGAVAAQPCLGEPDARASARAVARAPARLRAPPAVAPAT